MTVKKMDVTPNMASSAEDEVRETMTSKRLRVRIGYATAAAQEISGDQAMSCELPDGRFALILSDGMGKGAPAAAESRRLVRRLRGNLKKGMSPARAIKDVNCFMIKPDSFATMDLALLDWARGQAKFYKMGAASSFLIRGSHVRRIDQAALPIGIIPTLKLTHRSASLALGDIIVMVSDGITEADKDDDEAQWLQEILAHVVPQSREGAAQQSKEQAAPQSREGAAQQSKEGASQQGKEQGVAQSREGAVPQSREGAAQQSKEQAAQQGKEGAAQQNLAPRRLAQQILAEAQQRYGCRENDDLTVLVALVESTR